MLRRMRLAVFDGPEYHRRRVLRSRGALLIHSDDRVEDFSCSSRAAREIATALSQAGEPLVAVGQSLGALAALHVHWTNPGLFAGLLLQSGSFFHRDTENYEREFPRFGLRGSTVTVNGAGFVGATDVMFGSVGASFTPVSATQRRAITTAA